MPTSQLTMYSSSDAGGPGLMAGAAGDLIRILDACLVDGYAGKAAAGWTHPVATAGNIASYKQGAGCLFGCVINDNGPNVTSTYKEAWITGWETVAGVGAPVGSGTGQFPTPAQLLVTGHGVIRKSVSADAVGRVWNLHADASTWLLLIDTGDAATTAFGYYFGDVFSVNGVGDIYRCALIAGQTENSASAGVMGLANIVNTACVGHFMARAFGGGGGSITVGKHGDAAKSTNTTAFNGILQTPNAADNSYYLSPIWVHENASSMVRGRLRGVFQICHDHLGFAWGQTIDGGNDYAGKAFTIVRSLRGGATSTGAMAVETSATVETN